MSSETRVVEHDKGTKGDRAVESIHRLSTKKIKKCVLLLPIRCYHWEDLYLCSMEEHLYHMP